MRKRKKLDAAARAVLMKALDDRMDREETDTERFYILLTMYVGVVQYSEI